MTAVEPRLGISGTAIRAINESGRGALIGYLPVGFPDVSTSIEAMTAIVEGRDGLGADLVEIGMPYSDPMMDGIAIQHATTRALERGVRTRDLFTAVDAVAKAGVTPMAMIYWNLVEQYGVERFARDFSNAGGAGLITPDLTPDEAAEWIAASDSYGLDRVFLIAPSSTDERLAMTLEHCRGWAYATAVMGVTGTREESSTAAPILVDRAKKADPDLPVCVGLGISNGSQAAQTVSFADGAIIGSALVKCLIAAEEAQNTDLSQLRTTIASLAAGVRQETL